MTLRTSTTGSASRSPPLRGANEKGDEATSRDWDELRNLKGILAEVCKVQYREELERRQGSDKKAGAAVVPERTEQKAEQAGDDFVIGLRGVSSGVGQWGVGAKVNEMLMSQRE